MRKEENERETEENTTPSTAHSSHDREALLEYSCLRDHCPAKRYVIVGDSFATPMTLLLY